MLSLLDLISANQPQLQTQQALLVIGLQNDFILPDGRLPVDNRNGFLQRICSVLPKFRELSAHIIWTQTLYEADRMANDPTTGEGDAVVVGGLVDGVESSTDDDDALPKDLIPPTQSRSSRQKQRALDLLKKVSARRRAAPREASQSAAEEDEELFLLKSSKKGPACVPNTKGADFVDDVKASIEPKDTVLQTTNYSAFLGTKLLLILRAKLVTELFICGCITNISVLATVVDAARHGIKINIISDGLGYRKRNRHDEALKRMVEFFDADVVTIEEIRTRQRPKSDVSAAGRGRQSIRVDDDEDNGGNLEDLISRMRITDNSSARTSLSGRTSQQPAILVNGRHRTLSDASEAESRATTDTKVSDEQFAEMLSQGAKVAKEQPTPPAGKQNNLVKTKIRMRSRNDKSKKEEEKKPRPGSSKPAEGSSGRQVKATAMAEAPTKPPKEAEPSTAGPTPRASALTKAESSDKLRDSPAKHEQSLKSSISQPTLSESKSEDKDVKPSASRMRLSLSRSSKPESSNAQPAAPEKSEKANVKSAPETPKKPHIKPPIIPITPSSPSPSEKTNPMGKKLQPLTSPVLRPGDRIAEGDSSIIYNFFHPELRHPSDRSKPLTDLIFQQLYNEVQWQKMLHQQGEVPRLVCCQGDFGSDGSMPVYRHPTDQVLPLLHFSAKVQVVRKQAEKLVGHPLNHVLIQLYRSGQDFISEHSDKTLDIVRGSSIVNVSFGAERTMRLRTKKASSTSNSKSDQEDLAARTTQRVPMPHNSMFILGLQSNRTWLHGINADKRLETERSEEERAYHGMRISLTFRHIGTFLDAENSMIWGQGATSKEQRNPSDVINDDEEENEKLVRAFSRENHNSDFDWDEWYGDGFDVLHFRNAPEDTPILFTNGYDLERKMVQAFLWESKINHVVLEATNIDTGYEKDRQLIYRDNDISHTETNCAISTLLYLDQYYPLDRDDRGRVCKAESFDILSSLSYLLRYCQHIQESTRQDKFEDLLDLLEEKLTLSSGPFIAGRRISVADFAIWPVVDEAVEWGSWTEQKYPALTEYYRMLHKKKKTFMKIRNKLPEIKKGPTAKGKEKQEKEEAT